MNCILKLDRGKRRGQKRRGGNRKWWWRERTEMTRGNNERKRRDKEGKRKCSVMGKVDQFWGNVKDLIPETLKRQENQTEATTIKRKNQRVKT